jgi:hypothetical protein
MRKRIPSRRAFSSTAPILELVSLGSELAGTTICGTDTDNRITADRAQRNLHFKNRRTAFDATTAAARTR